jgi:ABC-type phosphate transport system auxiliary subunit
MKLSELQNLIREEVKTVLSEKDQAEINAEKEEMDARVANTDTQIKALQKKLGVLKKKSQEVAKQKPDETGA